MLHILVDFNSMMQDEKERVVINNRHHKDLVKTFVPGMSVILTDEEMEVEAVLEFDEKYQVWFGVPDWTTQLDVLDESTFTPKV